jgi:hypothetical protein
LVSGPLAPPYAEELVAAAEDPPVTVTALEEARFLIQAPEHERLCDLLASVTRPSGRGLRVEVDPEAL